MSRACAWAVSGRAKVLLTLSVQLGACNEDNALTLRDTEARRFEAKCEAKKCALTRLDAAPSKAGAHAVLSHTGRLVGVCDVEAPDATPRDWDCRVLECDSARECPPLHGLQEGHCLNGLCIDPANPLSPEDAVMLCLAGTGLGRNAPMQIERYAMALNCGNPCRIPKPCRQP